MRRLLIPVTLHSEHSEPPLWVAMREPHILFLSNPGPLS